MGSYGSEIAPWSHLTAIESPSSAFSYGSAVFRTLIADSIRVSLSILSLSLSSFGFAGGVET